MITNVKTKVNENIRRMYKWMKFKAPPSFDRGVSKYPYGMQSLLNSDSDEVSILIEEER
ncbi:MAG TPA: hypothetical protein VE548_05295 [Nitrososphaeraceae archaeon]|nr:hypothetical protein [Nitrososphaeraceae archaeon]